MTFRFFKRSTLILGLVALGLGGCTGAAVEVNYGDSYYDGLLWNDYYHDRDVDVDVDINRPDRPDRPDRPVRPDRPTPPIATLPGTPRPPVAKPRPPRPPIHRPSGGGRLRG